ncbi:MAG TPA: M1 family aminopeptidase [Thermoanaerobaculia bacterium]|nr:M1 family aminopeptidase [Thermoanaerobaculia bacterium]
MTSRLLLSAGALLLAFSLHAEERLPSRVNAFDELTLSGTAPVSGASFAVGHLKLDLASGNASYVVAGKQQVGLYFRGKGTLRYEAEATELPIASHNVRRMSDQKIDGNVVTGSFDELLLLAHNVPLPALAGAGGEAMAQDLAKHLEHFRRNRDTPAAHSYVLHELAFPSKKFVHAQLRAGGDDLVYSYDEGETGKETLAKLIQPKINGPINRWLVPIVLSSQPIGGDYKSVFPAPYTLAAIDFTLVGDGEDAKLTITETIRRGAEQKALRFGMDDVLFDDPRVAGRVVTVNSVTDASGRKLPFDHEQSSLLVGVENVAGETIQLTFDISGNFLIRPANNNFWQLGTHDWFPQPSLGGQAYTVHSVVKVKKPFVAFAPGKTVSRREEGEFNVVENVLESPVQFEVVHAGKYETYEETRAGVTIRVASYAGKNERASKQLTNLAFSIIEYYEHFLGPFPFPEVNVIQVNEFGYGQAPPGTIFITNEAFNSMVGDYNRVFSQGINERFAHEIGHFYWGHTIKMPSVEEQWLTESFAEYSAALALKKYQGKAIYDRLVAVWKQRAQESTKLAPIAYANRISGDPMIAAQARQGLLYNKGPYLLYVLHKELGDEKFLTFLKSYQKSRRWRHSSTAEVISLLQFLTKKDYTPFFEKYYWGTAMPE